MTSVKPLVGVPPALLLVYSLLLTFYYYLSLKSYQEYFAFCAIFILSCCLLPASDVACLRCSRILFRLLMSLWCSYWSWSHLWRLWSQEPCYWSFERFDHQLFRRQAYSICLRSFSDRYDEPGPQLGLRLTGSMWAQQTLSWKLLSV